MLDDREIKRLLLRAAARDEGSAEAFARLYQLTAPLVLGVAQRIVGRREVAEEVLHDAFVKIWNAAGSFDPLANQPVAWMVAIARNRALDVVAAADSARVESLSDLAGESDADEVLDRLFDWSEGSGADEVEDLRRARGFLRRCLQELAAVERQALVLAYHHGLSHGELAAHLAKPLGTVKTWIRRGMENLRACVEHCMHPGTVRGGR
ncbi:MAG TPA: sigma-70 family RNA polymerase sigma factor [Burkholderiaceae bacterium]|jgi:RNA polymerase sigma-70 factor (ECF subfamily)|nr:sigma-70 family RNA polymerase sigma factor [Burkholderiaceae bacterium]